MEEVISIRCHRCQGRGWVSAGGITGRCWGCAGKGYLVISKAEFEHWQKANDIYRKPWNAWTEDERQFMSNLYGKAD